MKAALPLIALGGVLLLAMSGSTAADRRRVSFGPRLDIDDGPAARLKRALGPFHLSVDPVGALVWSDEQGPLGEPSGDLSAVQAWQQRADRLASEVLARLRSRQRPFGAGDSAGDQWSNFQFSVPQCPQANYAWSAYNPPPCFGLLVDEYGRPWPGKFGGGSTIGGNIEFIILTAAPLVAVAYPPAAPIIFAALAAYKTRGDAENLKDAGLQYAREQLPPEYQFAFDLGVGVAAGKDVDEAAIDAALAQLSPEHRAAYEQGRELYKGITS